MLPHERAVAVLVLAISQVTFFQNHISGIYHLIVFVQKADNLLNLPTQAQCIVADELCATLFAEVQTILSFFDCSIIYYFIIFRPVRYRQLVLNCLHLDIVIGIFSISFIVFCFCRYNL